MKRRRPASSNRGAPGERPDRSPLQTVPAPSPSAHLHLQRLLYLVFALSGLTGLVYQATWTRYLQLFLGHAAYAQVLVLSLFMGGMGVGALFAARLTARGRSPLRAYAAIEAVLGLAALGFHLAFVAVTGWAYDSLLPGSQGSTSATTLQWLLASLLVLPQSVLLGMTFPLMSAAVLRLGSGAGGRVFAMLYFMNSAGAVVGVLAAGFWLIEHHGLQRTMTVAGLANLAVAAAAWAIGTRGKARPAIVPAPAASAPLTRWLLGLAFLTAVASFVYEIAWLRMLALVQGSSTHAFETMLSAFILGIALGGLWVHKRIERFVSPLGVLGRVQILMGMAALATLPAYHLGFDVMASAMANLPRSDLGYAGYNVVGYLVSAGVMVPAAFCAGMTLPLLTAVLYAAGRGEAAIGAVYGWNTLGGIVGVALGALVLMPWLGLKNMLVFGAALDIALGLALLVYLWRRREPATRRLDIGLALTAVLGLTAVLWAFQLDTSRLASAVFRHGKAQLASDVKVLHHADGRTASVGLVAYPDGGLSVTTNGKPDAAINMRRARGERQVLPRSDEYTMTLAAVVPLSHLPAARRAAVIGHGSGLTTHVLLGSPVLERVDVIEIEPEMIEASRGFLPRVARAYEDPRQHVVIEDARAFFARAAQPYDIIVSEPSNPWVSGVASLYTPEFYRQARRALAPDGLFVQWFHLYEIGPPEVASMLAAIAKVFPDYLIYAANDTDVVLLAGNRVPAMTDAAFAWPDLRAELAYLGIDSADQLQLFQLASRRAVAPLFEDHVANSDFFPFLEFAAARSRFLGLNVKPLVELAQDPVPALEMLSGFEMPRLLGAVPPELPKVRLRFADVQRARLIARGLDGSADRAELAVLPAQDQLNLNRVRDFGAMRSEEDWRAWFGAWFSLAWSMQASGGAPALEAFLNRPALAQALQRAPALQRQMIEFLRVLGRRDLPALRNQGQRLLADPALAALAPPGFMPYTLLVTSTACLSGPVDAGCRNVLPLLDGLKPRTPLLELLLAHRKAQR